MGQGRTWHNNAQQGRGRGQGHGESCQEGFKSITKEEEDKEDEGNDSHGEVDDGCDFCAIPCLQEVVGYQHQFGHINMHFHVQLHIFNTRLTQQTFMKYSAKIY